MRRIPDTDLARCAVLPKEEKRTVLTELLPRLRIPYYSSFRSEVASILNITGGSLGILPREPWRVIRSRIEIRGRNPHEKATNIAVGKILYEFAEAAQITGRLRDVRPLDIGRVHDAKGWEHGVVVLEGQEVWPFVEPRKGKSRLTGDALLFVFSVMHPLL